MSSTQCLPGVWIRPFQRKDRRPVFELLAFLPNLYPGASSWLDRRLDDVERRASLCTVGGIGPSIGGILIETPKGKRSAKISTLFIRPSLTGFGMATRLLHRHRVGWLNGGVDKVHVTVSGERLGAIQRFLTEKGFVASIVDRDRYRIGSEEVVFTLSVH